MNVEHQAEPDKKEHEHTVSYLHIFHYKEVEKRNRKVRGKWNWTNILSGVL
jgi:hypothetical protein